jgi:RNA polymerase sigma-70 factor (ECF subfamily)
MLCQHSPIATRFLASLPGACAVTVPEEVDDELLIRAAREGDAEAYGSLVRKYQQRLCTSLTYVCGSQADAQDAAQEAFLRAYLNLRNYSGASAFYTWLYRIAVNAAISQHRRRRLPASHEHVHAGSRNEPPDQSEPLDERLLRQEQAAKVQQALAKLSDEHRTIVVLREMENCDYAQIAQILNLPVGTVRSRLYRARLQLREQLERILGDKEPARCACGPSVVRAAQ